MTDTITATFVRKRMQDSGKDQAPDYHVYEFTHILDSNGKEMNDKWIKETKLMQAVKFQKDKQYEITLSEPSLFVDSVRLPFPKKISWDGGSVYMKGNNSIVKLDSEGKERNLSVPFNKTLGISNSDTAAFNKFQKGTLTEALLFKMNAKGIFYRVEQYAPNDKRNGGCSASYSHSRNENQIIVERETQADIDKDVALIQQRYVNKSIAKHFNVQTKIIQLKKN